MLDNFKGQERVKNNIRVILEEGKIRGKIPHMGIFAQKGMGKTTLAQLIIKEIKAYEIYINGTAIKDSAALLKKIYEAKKQDRHCIVFIDEAHALPKHIMDNFLSVLEEPSILCYIIPKTQNHWKIINGFKTQVKVEKGEIAEAYIPKNVSFILATTHKGSLSPEILSRLECIDLDDYTKETYFEILKDKTDIKFKDEIFFNIIDVSRNPRDAKSKLNQLIAYIKTFHIEADFLTSEQFEDFLNIKGIEKDGCNTNDIFYLKILASTNCLGLSSITSMMGIKIEEVQTIIEPWLLKLGYVSITPKGRSLTPEGRKRIGYEVPFEDDGFDLK